MRRMLGLSWDTTGAICIVEVGLDKRFYKRRYYKKTGKTRNRYSIPDYIRGFEDAIFFSSDKINEFIKEINEYIQKKEV